MSQRSPFHDKGDSHPFYDVKLPPTNKIHIELAVEDVAILEGHLGHPLTHRVARLEQAMTRFVGDVLFDNALPQGSELVKFFQTVEDSARTFATLLGKPTSDLRSYSVQAYALELITPWLSDPAKGMGIDEVLEALNSTVQLIQNVKNELPVRTRRQGNQTNDTYKIFLKRLSEIAKAAGSSLALPANEVRDQTTAFLDFVRCATEFAVTRGQGALSTLQLSPNDSQTAIAQLRQYRPSNRSLIDNLRQVKPR
jgi:hypothetical protein